jgi:hypothetical protein
MTDKSNYNKFIAFVSFFSWRKVQTAHALNNFSINSALCAIIVKFEPTMNPIQNTAIKQ